MRSISRRLAIVLALLVCVSCAACGCSSGTDNAGVATVSGSGR